MSISWGKRSRVKFTALGALAQWSPPAVPVLFAITYKQDPHDKPKSHTVLYFGQAEDPKQAQVCAEDVANFWSKKGGDVNNLYVFVHPMPQSTQDERSNICEQLVSEYYPHCNA